MGPAIGGRAHRFECCSSPPSPPIKFCFRGLGSSYPPNPTCKGGSRRDPPPMLLHKNMSQVLSKTSVTLLLLHIKFSPDCFCRWRCCFQLHVSNKATYSRLPGSLLSRSGCSFFRLKENERKRKKMKEKQEGKKKRAQKGTPRI